MVLEASVIDVTADDGRVIAPEWLARAETVHRQLRDRLPADYRRRLAEIFAGGGRMAVAAAGDAVRGVALWRLVENTYEGRRLYVDDLVTDAAYRWKGIGRTLLEHIESKAQALGCDVIALDSGTQRHEAHRFYFREGFVIPSFCFRKEIK